MRHIWLSHTSTIVWRTLACMLPLAAQAADLPTGGQIVAGSGSISQSGTTLTVTQDSARMAADWQSFSIGAGNTVNFVQPSADAVALNRVLGSDVSVIRGALNANGKVFLVNPNGVLFSQGSEVNAGGLVASTMNLRTEDFMAGNYTFEGDSSNAILNQGNITTAAGGTVALIAATITNEGSITAPEGNVLLGAGRKVTLDMGGPVKLEVKEGALNTLIKQGGAIRADGGRVYLTAKAAGDLASSVINHTGITEAKTLANGKKGEIVLLGDMKKGRTEVSGTLDASAPQGGDGGFIETSAATVDTKPGLHINAGSAQGTGGHWLIDPYNYVIDASAASTINGALDTGTNVTVITNVNNTTYGSSGNSSDIGDITVDAAITKSAGNDASLSLIAANSIILNQNISSSFNKLTLNLDADNDSGTRDGGGIIILNSNLTTLGGNVNFGTGASISIGGVNTKVGGDVYVGGGSAQTISTGGGSVTVNGEMLIGNSNGLTINSGGGNVVFGGILNSANSYTGVNAAGQTWQQAKAAAASGTGANDGDTYLATITSRLENAIASRAVNYQQSWLGGQRVVGIGTNNLWRWTSGPEGLMDGGNGLAFFTQNGSNSVNGSSGTSYNGGYTNWNGTEPNNSSGSSLADAAETAIQFVGNLGRWNDLPENSSTLNYYVRETNATPSPLTVNAGAGNITFSGRVGGNKALSSLTATGNTIAINGGGVTTTGVQTYNGNITLGAASTTLQMTGADTNFALGSNRSITNAYSGTGSFTIKTTGAIELGSGSSITSSGNALNTTLWADSDETNGGYIWLKQASGTGASISTGGGSLTLGGGSDIASGVAWGQNSVMGNGITLDTASLQTAGGNIILRGRSGSNYTAYASSDSGSTTNANGIRLHGSNLIDAGTGTVSLTGYGASTDGSSNGIETNATGWSKILSAAANTTAISLYGDATSGAASNGWGTFLWGTNTSGLLIAATGTNGGISLEGRGRDGISNGGGTHLQPNAFVLAASGPITLTGIKGGASSYEDVVINGTVGAAATLPAGFSSASPVTSSSSNITITANSLSANRIFGGASFTGSAVRSSGILTIKPRTTSKGISVLTYDPSDGSLWIDPTDMFGSSGLFKSGFSKVVFGTSTGGDIALDGYSVDSDTELNSGGSVTLGNITIDNNDLIVNVSGGGIITDSGNVVVDGLKIAAASASAALNSAGNAIRRVAANLVGLTLYNSSAMTVGTVEGLDGITATSNVDLSTQSGNLTVAKNITTTSTNTGAITLNAGKATAAGTATGGNLILSGNPSLSVGSGGRATLYTGSVTGSTGLGALITAGKSRFNSDETTTNFTTALGSGLFAVYREQPAITVTAENISKVADGLAYTGTPGVTYSGFVNGDSTAQLGGTLTFSGTGIGARSEGTYTLIPGGLSNGLGYAFTYAGGTLTIDPNQKKEAAVQNVQVQPALQPVQLAANTGAPNLSAGGMEVVELPSSSGKNPQVIAQNGGTGSNPGFMQMFVIDGGVNLPYGMNKNKQ